MQFYDDSPDFLNIKVEVGNPSGKFVEIPPEKVLDSDFIVTSTGSANFDESILDDLTYLILKMNS